MDKLEETEKDIRFVTNEVAELLISKNRAYGDSALNPVRIFSKAESMEQLKVRIDDKLSRLASTPHDKADAFGEDVEKDLLGYLVLLRIARLRKSRKETEFFDAKRRIEAGDTTWQRERDASAKPSIGPAGDSD